MKLIVFFRYVTAVAIVFNLKLLQADVWSRVQSPTFIPLCFVTIGLFWAYAIWITSQYTRMMNSKYECKGNQSISLAPKRSLPLYLLRAAAPVLLFHMGAIWCAAALTEDTADIVGDYMRDYFPMLFLLVLGYAALLFFRPEYALVNSIGHTKEKTNQQGDTGQVGLDRHIDLYTLFSHLLNNGGMGPLFKNMAVRFFDIVFIETYSNERYVILSNGERILCDHILDELKKRGLDGWMFKISKNYYINMMLLFYPIDTRVRKLALQSEVYQNMLKKLDPEKIEQICTIGRGMKSNLVKDFLANKNRMDHKGWDDFIPLR